MRYTNNANTSNLDGYARLDVRANYRMTSEWRLLARVNNVLDANYSLRDGYNTPGINGFVGLEYRQKYREVVLAVRTGISASPCAHFIWQEFPC